MIPKIAALFFSKNKSGAGGHSGTYRRYGRICTVTRAFVMFSLYQSRSRFASRSARPSAKRSTVYAQTIMN